MHRPCRLWTTAVRALALVAFLLVGHDLMMTSPAAAHETGVNDQHIHADEPSMPTMTMDSFDVPTGAEAIEDDPLADHPAPTHEDSDCGVIRNAAMPGSQTLASPDIAHDGSAYLADVAADSPLATQITFHARAPTVSPRTRQAMLQIFRV